MSDDLPRVAVLLAAYNGMPWIEEQISSILAQVDVSVGLFISIDPSTDSTDLWCKGLAAKHSKCMFYPPQGLLGELRQISLG